MHPPLTEIRMVLNQLVETIDTSISGEASFAISFDNWSFPGLNKRELIDIAKDIIEDIDSSKVDDLGGNEALLTDYVQRIKHLAENTVAKIDRDNRSASAVVAYLFTMQGLQKAVSKALHSDYKAESLSILKQARKSVRAMEASVNALEPRTTSLASMVEAIESAYNAAEQLPTDLESLAEAKDEIATLTKTIRTDQEGVSAIYKKSQSVDDKLDECLNNARNVLERCETAYAAATSVGLAAAFSERSSSLAFSMRLWVGGLVCALLAGGIWGSHQLGSLSNLIINPGSSGSVVTLNILLALLSVGAPVWFAWLATKQIGERFRLAEDYAFKASISRAYEGFRREAARIDEEMEARLLSSALSRLDEPPLRLVEATSHGSPWHELLSSEVVKQAIKTVPGFMDQLKECATKAITAVCLSRSEHEASRKSDVDEQKSDVS